jgi:hypothetical protein
MTRFGSLLAAMVLSTGLMLSGCGSSKSDTGNTPANTTVAPGSNNGPPSTTPCTIPQNNGGDHDSDNNGGPSDGDGCDV